MPSCIDNDVRWSHGQPFTFILDLSDNVYPLENFLDAELIYEADGGDGARVVGVWRLIKAIRNSPKKGQLTAILQATDPQLNASGHGINPKAPAAGAVLPLRDTVSGPVATFETSSSSSATSTSSSTSIASQSITKQVATQSGSSSSSSGSSSSSASGCTPQSIVRVRFTLPRGVPGKV
jgi:hypothetical protein